jgi:F0F1-type ATP synthase membrane subunit a
MLAGHTLMYILGMFMFAIVELDIVWIFSLPMVVIMLVAMLEICIAFIQTYVFVILLIIYVNDMINIFH